MCLLLRMLIIFSICVVKLYNMWFWLKLECRVISNGRCMYTFVPNYKMCFRYFNMCYIWTNRHNKTCQFLSPSWHGPNDVFLLHIWNKNIQIKTGFPLIAAISIDWTKSPLLRKPIKPLVPAFSIGRFGKGEGGGDPSALASACRPWGAAFMEEMVPR
jgi:hypothetical protein